ncbi:hypothetical protein Fcan01_25356 [Folsomia candida]|uniref:Uncharacterized protein n=1 Tax=Folsomia candida TaxID=158441 RepID=A0A226D485_FOLCA|nr:hypothetical protein Fcan01_25356 [Folsomia candida]
MEASDYHYKTSNLPQLHKNVYKILVSAVQKSKLQKILKDPHQILSQGNPMLDNFGILFLTRKKTSSLCVQPIGNTSKNISTMQCKQTENGNIVQLFRDLHAVPILWRLDSFRHMDFEQRNDLDLQGTLTTSRLSPGYPLCFLESTGTQDEGFIHISV